MKPTLRFLTALMLASLTVLHAATPDFSKITSRADLDAVVAATADAALKQALTEHAAAILAALIAQGWTRQDINAAWNAVSHSPLNATEKQLMFNELWG